MSNFNEEMPSLDYPSRFNHFALNDTPVVCFLNLPECPNTHLLCMCKAELSAQAHNSCGDKKNQPLRMGTQRLCEFKSLLEFLIYRINC